MDPFGAEFINVSLPPRDPDHRVPDPFAELRRFALVAGDPTRAFDNTRAMLQALATLQAAGGGYLLFPPGRYYLGTALDGERPASDTDADILIGDKVTLRFMPGAQLVPLSYPVGSRNSGYRVVDRQEPSGRYKVRIEIQGHIEAGIHPIFDVFVEDGPVVVGGELLATEAGTIFFARSMVRQIYPEWWGAVPALPDLSNADLLMVRRTTVALQAAFDAAHGAMAEPDVNAGGHITQGPAKRPPIPIVLMNDYVIDRELSLGTPIAETSVAPALGIHTSHPRNPNGFVMRGGRGPSTGQTSNVRIIAWNGSRAFNAEPRGGASEYTTDPVTQVYGTASLLGIRGVFGFTIENVTFDGSFVAPRCVTIEASVGTQHHDGFEGCSFRNARSVLMHLGGELRPVSGTTRFVVYISVPATPDTPGDYGSVHWQGGDDLSSLRFVRCRFETDPSDVIGSRPIVGLPISSLTGVFYRAAQSLGVEFRACLFRGPASPMIHSMGGRFSLDSCHFRTTSLAREPDRLRRVDLPSGSTNGTDIFVDTPPHESSTPTVEPSTTLGPLSPGCFTARNVVSESAQFLATFMIHREKLPGATVQAAVLLQNVRHLPPTVDAVRPSVHWNGLGAPNFHCPLILMGCDLPRLADGVRPSGLFSGPLYVAEGVEGPIIDLGNRITGGGLLFSFPMHIVPGADFRTMRWG